MKITNEYLTLAESIAADARDSGDILMLPPGEMLEILQQFRDLKHERDTLKDLLMSVAI